MPATASTSSKRFRSTRSSISPPGMGYLLSFSPLPRRSPSPRPCRVSAAFGGRTGHGAGGRLPSPLVFGPTPSKREPVGGELHAQGERKLGAHDVILERDLDGQAVEGAESTMANSSASDVAELALFLPFHPDATDRVAPVLVELSPRLRATSA